MPNNSECKILKVFIFTGCGTSGRIVRCYLKFWMIDISSYFILGLGMQPFLQQPPKPFWPEALFPLSHRWWRSGADCWQRAPWGRSSTRSINHLLVKWILRSSYKINFNLGRSQGFTGYHSGCRSCDSVWYHMWTVSSICSRANRLFHAPGLLP